MTNDNKTDQRIEFSGKKDRSEGETERPQTSQDNSQNSETTNKSFSNSQENSEEQIFRKIIFERKQRKIDFLKFDAQQNYLWNQYNLAVSEKNRQIYETVSNIKHAKEALFENLNFSSDSTIVSKAISWYKNTLLKEISNNSSNLKKIDFLQTEIKEKQESLNFNNKKIDQKTKEIKDLIEKHQKKIEENEVKIKLLNDMKKKSEIDYNAKLQKLQNKINLDMKESEEKIAKAAKEKQSENLLHKRKLA
ncbi:hypothetical protein MHBO_001905, partial [Bonamia ostreae]